MIISHKYRFVFVEFPQTGCSAVGTELMANYGGERILYKHAQYHEFLKNASPDEREYFSFSTIRNPMDIVVSKYFKYKTNHKSYVDKKVKFGKLRKYVNPGYEKSRRDYVVNNDASFEEYFLRFHSLPYSAWSLVNHDKLNFVMHFEELTADFERVLLQIGIAPIRELPIFNKTSEKKRPFSEYYESDEARSRAIRVFGPYMKQWGYTFPESWKASSDLSAPDGLYNFINIFRKTYWRWLR